MRTPQRGACSKRRHGGLGCRELWLCDNDFADWPIGERAVIESLSQWAGSHRRLTLIASTFDEVARRHARWNEWRKK